MKKIIFVFMAILAFAFVSCKKVNISVPVASLAFSPEWQKFKAPFLENFKKVASMGNRIMLVTSDKDYYYSCDKSLQGWLKESFPATTSNPSPVMFNGYLYLNTDQGVYKLNSPGKWEKVSDIVAKKLVANKKSLFLIKDAGQLKNDSLICFDGKKFFPNLALRNLENDENNKFSTWYTSLNFIQCLGDTLFVSYIHSVNNFTAIGYYYSYNNGQSWTLFDANNYYLAGCYSEKGVVGSFYQFKNSYGMSYFNFNGSYTFQKFGKITAFENSTNNTNSDFWFTARLDSVKGYDTYLDTYAIYNGKDIQLKTKIPLSDIKLLDSHFLVAVGDSGTVYALKKQKF